MTSKFHKFFREMSALVLVLTTFGHTIHAQSKSGANNGAGPVQPQSEVDLARIRLKIDEQRQLNMARLRQRARDLEGSTVINDVSLPQQTLAGLVLVREVYVEQLRTFIAQARGWKELSFEQKKAAVRALDQYNSNYSITGDVATWPKEGIHKCDAMDVLNLHLAQEFQPILAVSPPGMFSSTFSDVLTNAPASPNFDELTKKFDEYLDYGIKGADDEIWRVQAINTVEGMTEFLGAQYAASWQVAANLYGHYTRDLLSSLPEFAFTYQQVRRGQAEIRRYKLAAAVGAISIIAIAAAPVAYLAAGQAMVATGQAVGSAINLGTAVLQIAYDGNEFVGIYGEMSNAQKGGAALGRNSATSLKREAYIAGAGVVLDGTFVGMAANDFNNAMQAARRPIGNAANQWARSAMGDAAAPSGTAATNAAGTSTEILSTAKNAEPSFERGIEKARSLGITGPDVDRVVAMASTPPSARIFPSYRSAVNQAQGLFEGIDELGALEARARAAGVAEDAIRAAYNRARQATTNRLEAFGRNLPTELQVLTARAKGATIVVGPVERQAFEEIAGGAARGVVHADPGALNGIVVKLNGMGAGLPVNWTREELQLLAYVRRFPNRANLYAYSPTENYLYRVFNDKELAIADAFFNSPNRVAIARGQMPLSAVPIVAERLPLFPPTQLANPSTGEWLTAEEIRALPASQLSGISPEVVQSLGDSPIKDALRERLAAEAAQILTPPLSCPPPQVTPAQILWATRILWSLGNDLQTSEVPSAQLVEKSDFKSPAPPEGTEFGSNTGAMSSPAGGDSIATANTTGATGNSGPVREVAQQSVPPVDNHKLAVDLCERAHALRDMAANERMHANEATDPKAKAAFEDQAKLSDLMAKEREDLARSYDPNACPETRTAKKETERTGSTSSNNQSDGTPPTTPSSAGQQENSSSGGIGPNIPLGGTSAWTPVERRQTIDQSAADSKDHTLAVDLCERARSLRDIAKKEREHASQASDPKARAAFEQQAKLSDFMAREREELARHYDPKACPETPNSVAQNPPSAPEKLTQPETSQADKPVNQGTEAGGAMPGERRNVPAPQNQLGDSQIKDKAALAAPAGAQTLEPNTVLHTKLAVQSRCSTPQTFTVETDGFPNSFLQTSGPESIQAGQEHNFTLTLDTHGLAPGIYRGRFIITCISCGETCEQSKRAVAYQFFIPEDAAGGEGPGPGEKRVISNGVVAGYVHANPDPIDKLEHPYIFRPWLPPAMQYAYIQPTSVEVRPDGTVVEKGGAQKTLGTVQK